MKVTAFLLSALAIGTATASYLPGLPELPEKPDHKPPHPTDKPSYPKPTHKPKYTTKTVYETKVHTVTSCAPDKPDCPYKGHGPHVVTETVAVSTTVCPVEETEEPEKPTYPEKPTPEEPEEPCPTTTSVGTVTHKPTKTDYPVKVTAGAARVAGGMVAAVAGVVAFL